METERLIIDALKNEDKEAYFRNISHDKEVLKTFICRYAENLEDLDFEPYVNREDMFAIRLKDTGELIGLILYFDDDGESLEIGYGIGSSYWGKGYAFEAVKRFLEFCFYEKGVRRVNASFFTGNEASKRVMEKCGMMYDHFSPQELTYLGMPRDLIYYSIRKNDYDIMFPTMKEPSGKGGNR